MATTTKGWRKRWRTRRTRGEASLGIVVVGAAELLKMECLFPDEDDDEETCHAIDSWVTM